MNLRDKILVTEKKGKAVFKLFNLKLISDFYKALPLDTLFTSVKINPLIKKQDRINNNILFFLYQFM